MGQIQVSKDNLKYVDFKGNKNSTRQSWWNAAEDETQNVMQALTTELPTSSTILANFLPSAPSFVERDVP